MSYPIHEIEGIGATYRDKLAKAGIKTTADLLTQCCDRKGRGQVSSRAGVSEGQLLKWANMADLMRIKGIGPEFAELLEAAGVDTVKELRNRKPDNLTSRMQQVNTTRKVTRRNPPLTIVEGWVSEAKSLSPVISH